MINEPFTKKVKYEINEPFTKVKYEIKTTRKI